MRPQLVGWETGIGIGMLWLPWRFCNFEHFYLNNRIQWCMQQGQHRRIAAGNMANWMARAGQWSILVWQ